MTELYYDFHAFVCTNRRPDGHEYGCCASKGSERLANYMKRKAKELGIGQDKSARFNQSGCLGRCDLGPVMVIYPEGVWYAPKSESDIDEILTSHLQQGQRVERLLLPPRE
jgi:(2Fe-2S) ferredoxin